MCLFYLTIISTISLLHISLSGMRYNQTTENSTTPLLTHNIYKVVPTDNDNRIITINSKQNNTRSLGNLPADCLLHISSFLEPHDHTLEHTNKDLYSILTSQNPIIIKESSFDETIKKLQYFKKNLPFTKKISLDITHVETNPLAFPEKVSGCISLLSTFPTIAGSFYLDSVECTLSPDTYHTCYNDEQKQIAIGTVISLTTLISSLGCFALMKIYKKNLKRKFSSPHYNCHFKKFINQLLKSPHAPFIEELILDQTKLTPETIEYTLSSLEKIPNIRHFK